jgi:hypothetical protein
MDRVGGYLAWQALCEDARAYDDILAVMAGEADAERITRMMRKAGA